MPDPCKFPLCQRLSEKNGYCVGHRIYADASATSEVKPKPIKKVSDKMKEALKELAKIKKRKLKEQPNCQLGMPGCTKSATTLHHVRGRVGKQLLKEEDLLPSCYSCNGQVEEKDGEARDKGLKKSKHEVKK
jgi:hypothetical protein